MFLSTSILPRRSAAPSTPDPQWKRHTSSYSQTQALAPTAVWSRNLPIAFCFFIPTWTSGVKHFLCQLCSFPLIHTLVFASVVIITAWYLRCLFDANLNGSHFSWTIQFLQLEIPMEQRWETTAYPSTFSSRSRKLNLWSGSRRRQNI